MNKPTMLQWVWVDDPTDMDASHAAIVINTTVGEAKDGARAQVLPIGAQRATWVDLPRLSPMQSGDQVTADIA